VAVADAYECWRWGKYWVRAGELTMDQFVGNGYPTPWHEEILAWNRAHGCDTVEGLNEIVRAGKLPQLIEEATRRPPRSTSGRWTRRPRRCWPESRPGTSSG